MQAWTKNDFSIAADDWAAEGELRSPGGQAKKSRLQAAMADYFKHFKDLSVVVTQIFTSADGTRAAIEWAGAAREFETGRAARRMTRSSSNSSMARSSPCVSTSTSALVGAGGHNDFSGGY